MQERKALLILHGKQALNAEVRAAVQARREEGWQVDVRVTWEGGDAQRLVNEALQAGYPTLIAGGGDGTLRDVAEAMALAKTKASLALLPLGTANDFARAAGIPLEPLAALSLLDIPAQPIDLGEVDGQVFLNMATGGFGSNVTANTSEDLKRMLGGAAYFLTGLTRFAEVQSSFGRFTGPDFPWEGEFLALGPRSIRGNSIITSADTKTARARSVPIAGPIREHVKRLPFPMARRTLQTRFKTAATAIGRPDMHLHDLRHSTASLLAQAGVSLQVIGAILGHSSPQTTARYAHLVEDNKQEAMAKLGASPATKSRQSRRKTAA